MHNWFFKVKMVTILDAENSTDFHFNHNFYAFFFGRYFTTL